MLSDKLRDGANSKLFKALLIIIIISFVLTGVGGYLIPRLNTDPVTVGEYKISSQEWENQYNQEVRTRLQYNPQFATILEDPAIAHQLRTTVLENMINNVALNTYAFESGIRIGDDQVRSVIANTPAFFKDGKFDNDLYLASIRSVGLTPEYYGEQLRVAQMSHSLTQPLVNLYVNVFDNEVRYLYELFAQQRVVDLYSINNDAYVDEIKLTDTQVEDFYKQNQQKYFMAPANVKFNYILLSLDDLKKDLKPTDNELLDYYNLNSNDFNGSFEEQKEAVKQAYINQKAKEIFNEKASTLADISYENPDSLDPTAKATGLEVKDSGVVVLGQTDLLYPLSDAKVQSLAFNENNTTSNINSEVINIDENNALVLNVYDYHEQAIKTFDEVKDEARHLALVAASAKKANEVLSKLATSLNASVSDPNVIVKKGVNIDRGNTTDVSLELNEEIFAIPSTGDARYTINIGDKQTTLAVLQNIQLNTELPYDQYQQLLRSQMVQAQMLSVQTMLYSGARSEVEIEYNDEAIKLVEQRAEN